MTTHPLPSPVSRKDVSISALTGTVPEALSRSSSSGPCQCRTQRECGGGAICPFLGRPSEGKPRRCQAPTTGQG